MTSKEFDKLFNEFFNMPNYYSNLTHRSYAPSKMTVDLQDDKLELAFSVVGHDPKNVEVTLTEDKVSIRAKKDIEDKSVTGQFISDINETITLTKEYDGTTARAEIKNGLLLIGIDKREEQKPKKLSIKF
jgi:HSP20 family protein